MTNTVSKSDIAQIFYDVLHNFIWTADPEVTVTYNGKEITFKDKWIRMVPDMNGVLRGDCEDFCLYCSNMLAVFTGLDIKKRKLTYCVTESGEGHMILEADGWVLDNRQRRLTTIRKLKRDGYRDFAQPVGPITGRWEYL